MSKKKKPTNHYASTPYTQVPDGLWLSKPYKELSAHARCIFTVALALWDPYEPKKAFPMSYRFLRQATGFQYNTIAKATTELIVQEFLEKASGGGYKRNTSMFKLNGNKLSETYPKIRKGWLNNSG